MGLYDFSVQEAQNLLLARQGTQFISDNTQSFSVNFSALLVLSDAKFHTLTDATRTDNALAASKLADSTSTNAITVRAGTVLYGQITSIRLHSGAVLGIKGF